MTDFIDIDELLGNILDDTKPLPKAGAITTPDAEDKALAAQLTTEQEMELAAEVRIELAAEEQANLDTPSVDEDLNQFNAQDEELLPFTDTKDRTETIDIPQVGMPKFDATEIAKTMDIRNFATMVTLNTKRWHAKVKDRQASRNAAKATGADENAFETRKRLLAGADEKLKAIHKAIDSARAKYYELTLPWTTTGIDDTGRRAGARLLPNTLFFDFTAEMAQHKAAMVKALDEFVPAYPDLVEQAKEKLGSSFDIREYPNADSIRGHFDLSFDFQPIPIGTDFKGLPQQQCDALARAIEDKTGVMMENAMQDLWIRVHEAVGRMAERLTHPDKLFHHTLVTNVRSVANQLKHLNITHDKRIDELRQYIEQHLCQHDVEDLRKIPTVRAKVGAAATETLNRMAKMGV